MRGPLLSAMMRFMWLCLATLVVFAGPVSAADLQISQYSFTPDPVPNGGSASFSIRATNLGPETISDAALSVSISSRFQVSPGNFPAFCSLSGAIGNQTLTCALQSLPPGDINLNFTAVAIAIGSANSTATISSVSAADPNSANNSLTVVPGVISGADLSTTKSDGTATHMVAAGSTIRYLLTANNAGPNATDAVTLTDALPPLTDFTFVSAVGTNWNCARSGLTVTCTYTGPALIGSYPPVTVTGVVASSTGGTITNNASATLNSPLFGDPNGNNNAATPTVTTILPGTDLQATKVMQGSIVVGGSATITIGVRNNGPQSVAGASVSDTIDSSLGIGTLPAGCVAVGQTVTCTAAASISVGGNQSFVIPVTGLTPTAGLISNIATTRPPSGVIDPIPANDTARANFQVVSAGADLSLTKTKTPSPVAAGGDMVSIIFVRNNGPSALDYTPPNQLRVVDTLPVGETYVSADTPWVCTAAGQVVTCFLNLPGTLAPSSTRQLTLRTRADAATSGVLTNTACTGSTAGSTALPLDPNSANDCSAASSVASAVTADLSINKSVSLDNVTYSQVGINVPSNGGFYIRYIVKNENVAATTGPAATVVMVDPIAGTSTASTVTTASTSTGAGPTFSTLNGQRQVSWTLANLTKGATETLIVRVDRPLVSNDDAGNGVFVNTATVSSPDTFDSVATNNSSSATYHVDSISDVTITAKSISPASADVGVNATYTISAKNLGPNQASNVVVTDIIDPTRFALVGNPTTTRSGVTCTKDDATGTISCSLGSVNANTTYQVLQTVRPLFPFGGAISFPQTYQNTATVTTTTAETNTANNSGSVFHAVNGPVFDLALTKQEPGPEFDPIRFGDLLTYDVRVSNFGPSRANNVVVVDMPQPPAGNTMTFVDFSVNPVAASNGLSLYTPPAPNCALVGASVECRLDATSPVNNFLDSLRQTIFRLRFSQGGAPPTGPLTFTDRAQVTATEQPTTTTPAADSQLANNVATQTTTVLPVTDLEVVSKTRTTPSPASIGETIGFSIVIRNNGASPTTQVRVTDALPPGFVIVGTPTAVPAGSATLTSISCSGTNTILCILTGLFPADGSLVTIALNARANSPYAGPLLTDLTNNVSISPGQDSVGTPLSFDTVPSNNSKSAVVQISQSTIAGTVFGDTNLDNIVQSGEGIAGVTLTLSGTDAAGNAVSRTTTTDSAGNFLFDRLPKGTYSIVETQPPRTYDRYETAGSVGGTVNNATFGSGPAANTIGNIVLPANTAATGYLFEEVGEARIAGTIYRDLNNNGAQDPGETGFMPTDFPSSPQVRLTGTDYSGAAVNLIATVDNSGSYSFTVPPSDASGYTVAKLVQPTNTVDGIDRNGVGQPISGSAGRPAPEGVFVGIVLPAAFLTNRDFGELLSATIAGSIFLDTNANATRDPGEATGLGGGTVVLSGIDDLGAAVSCTITTDATGAFSFPQASDLNPACRVLRPGTYTLTETLPAGFSHVGVFIGSAGGSSGGASGANTPAPGAGNTVVGGIVIGGGISAIRYDFAEAGQGLAGTVYVDRNNNNIRDASELGIPGVTVKLSGTTSGGVDVCSIASCTAITDSSGNFRFVNLPGSGAGGHTLTEQSQATSPLSAYANGQTGAGTVSGVPRGTAGNDVITGIQLSVGEMGVNYRFGELAGSVAGHVFVDVSDTGVFPPGAGGIAGVVVTLSGTTSSGADICAQRAALTPPLGCAVTTTADGAYSFADLPAGTYTLVEMQPSTFADGKEGSGTPGGVVNNSAFGASAATNTIGTIPIASGTVGTGYDFGERGVAIAGRVFKDPQRDGVDSGGEPGIGGVTVQLLQNGVVIATTTTAADGSYSFPGLSVGTYTVTEIRPAGYGASSPTSVSATLTAGSSQRVDFANTVSTIAGSVFIDTSNDGVRQAGEVGIGGVTVTLSGTAANGSAINSLTTTDATGAFSFGDLLSGTYTLTETQPAAYANGLNSAGTASGVVGINVVSTIVLPAGVDAINYAFGELGQAIAGTVYVDTNVNGVRDGGDVGLAGVVVTLQRPDGSVVATTTTAADGSYSFPSVPPGNYVIVEAQPAGYGNAAENATNRFPLTVGTTSPPPVNFGETTGSIAGQVYNDSNNNGRRESSEPPIAGVTLTLSGIDARGNSVTATTVTGPDGSYRFSGIPGGTYTIAETQPVNYQDGIDAPGNAGGVAAAVPGDLISGITLAPAQDATGYLFGERGTAAKLSGSVWFDANHDRIRGGDEPGRSGWTVELRQGDSLVATATTGADGGYSFTDIPPGSNYNLLFRAPGNGVAFGSARPNETGARAMDGVVSAANPAGATFTTGQLKGLTLLPGSNTPQQSLPLDPSGVVYDSIKRVPVPGAVVKIVGPPGFDPASQLLGGIGNVTQTVGTDGIYQFLLLPGAPAGNYSFTVTPPSGGTYNPTQPSAIIPPCPSIAAVAALPDPFLVSTIDGPPPVAAARGCGTGVASTAYFLAFVLTGGVSANVVNNNIPLDPILGGAIAVTKTTPLANVSRGGLVPYTITARNTLAGPVPGISITDRVPAGFRFRIGSARLGGLPVTPVEQGPLLIFSAVNFAANEEKRIDLILTVGAGVGPGVHVNTAYAVNQAAGMIVSNLATASVRVEADADFDCSDILGKVFDDRNGNGTQDEEEPGLRGVRVVTVNGQIVTTDADGRYHITCPMIANEDRGSNFILKLDPRSLPTGYRLTTENPETVRLTRGKFAKLDFGAALLRVVRLDVTAAVFAGDEIAPDYQPKVTALIASLESTPSVLRIAYAARGEEGRLITRRITALRHLIERDWAAQPRRCRLIVELEKDR